MKRKSHSIPAIVLGMSVNGLGAVRALGRYGVPVHALDALPGRPGAASRYAVFRMCPDPRREPEALGDYLSDVIRRLGGEAVILPTGDDFNAFLHRHREHFGPGVRLLLPPAPLMDKLLDKKGQYELARAHGVPLPGTWFPREEKDLLRLAETTAYPVLLKGLSTGGWRARFGDTKAVLAHGPGELIAVWKDIRSSGGIEPLVQEIIPGGDERHYKICAYLDAHGNVLLAFTLRKIRQYPCDFGIGSSVVAVHQPQVARLGLDFLRAIGYSGVGSIEFKKDARDGVFKMIEINPRLWAQNSLPEACGQNFPLTAYRDLLGESIGSKWDFTEGVRWIAFKEDRASFLGYRRQGRMRLGQWLFDLWGGPTVWAVWSWDDPMPFLKETGFGLRPFFRAVRKFGRILRSWPKKESPSGDGIAVEVVEDTRTFTAMNEEWDALVEACGAGNPFLRHAWLRAWWEGYGRGCRLRVLRLRKGGETVGLAPLMIRRTRLAGVPVETVGFLANHWTRMDFILRDEHRTACIEVLAETLRGWRRPVVLAQMDPRGRNLPLIEQALARRGVAYRTTTKSHAYVPLDGTWDDYFNGRSRNFRMDSRRKLRRMEKRGEVRCVEPGPGNGTLDALGRVAERAWTPGRHLNIIRQEGGRVFYKRLFDSWGGDGRIDVSLLEVGGRPIAYMVGIREGATYFAFDTAYDRDWRDYSPGLVLHNLLLQRLYNEGCRRFDFGLIADYKVRWDPRIEEMKDLTIYPEGVHGWILRALHAAKGRMSSREGFLTLHPPSLQDIHRFFSLYGGCPPLWGGAGGGGIRKGTPHPASPRRGRRIRRRKRKGSTMHRKVTVTYEPDNSIKKGYAALLREVFQEVAASRWLTWQLFRRDFLGMYKQSLFGALWPFIVPMFSIGTFIVLNRSGVFAIGNLNVPYPIYAVLGMAYWQLFATGVVGCAGSLVYAGQMITKINFSKKSLVMAATGKSVIAFCVQMALVGLLLVLYKIVPPWTALLAFLVTIPVLLLTVGIGLILALVYAIMRDVGNMLTMFLTFLMFMTPVLYARPHTGILAVMTRWNPMYYFITTGRDLVLKGTVTEWPGFLWATAGCFLFFSVSLVAFHLTETRVAERI